MDNISPHSCFKFLALLLLVLSSVSTHKNVTLAARDHPHPLHHLIHSCFGFTWPHWPPLFPIPPFYNPYQPTPTVDAPPLPPPPRQPPPTTPPPVQATPPRMTTPPALPPVVRQPPPPVLPPPSRQAPPSQPPPSGCPPTPCGQPSGHFHHAIPIVCQPCLLPPPRS